MTKSTSSKSLDQMGGKENCWKVDFGNQISESRDGKRKGDTFNACSNSAR